ncbi:MAG: hypothetical protein HRU09_18890 [Oligoflexales bacterium]|nr:hypothetical protein [Oligoflexales bacterium]
MLISLCLGIMALFEESSYAKVTLHLGPASVGGGGPNPISIPPTNILDYELVWFNKDQTEISVSLFPGMFYGYRATMKNGGYISMGGGLVLNIHGFGPGVYSAFGYNSCGYFCFNIEYKQALGFITGMTISPYAVRIGMTFELF